MGDIGESTVQLTLHTDYTIRVLIYLATFPDRLVTVGEIAARYDISRNHLVKVVNGMAREGYIHTVRGKGGGMRLARDPKDIRLGAVVRHTESMVLLECFELERDRCPITSACVVKGVLEQAQERFLMTLDGYTLADVVKNTRRLVPLLSETPKPAP